MSKSCLLTCALIALCCFSMNNQADDWPMFMGNPQHTGVADSSSQYPIVSKSAKPDWQYSLHTQVSASPVVVGQALFVAAENGNLYCFDLATKKLQWLYHTEAGIASTPAVADGKLYFLSRDGFFYALEQVGGKLLWRFATKGEQRFGVVGGYGLPMSLGPVPDPWDFYLSSPLVHDGKVYFGSSDRHVYALDAANGELVWSFESDESIHSSPAYAGNKIFIGSWGTKLYALNAQTGKEAWHFQGGIDYQNGVMIGMAASPTLDTQNVYIGGRDGFFYALKQSDGTPVWSHPYNAAGSWVLSTAAVDDKNVYFATSDTALFVAVDKKTGVEKYRSSTHVWTYTSPVIVQNRFVFFGTMAGELYGLDKATGKKLWSYQTPEGKADINDIVDPVTHGLRGDKLFAADVQVQASVEYVKALGAFVASPIWVDNQLIAVTANGELLLFDARKHV
jgi:eukaryotic-like serine/threonine-protein kinase